MSSRYAASTLKLSQSGAGRFLAFIVLAGAALLSSPTADPVTVTAHPQVGPSMVAAAPAAALAQVVYHPSYLQPAVQQDPCCIISPSVAAQLIRQILAKLPGIADVTVDAATGTLTVSYDPAQVQEEQITALLTEEYFLP